MIDLNDPEIVESMKYLQVTTAERIKLQAQPFDGKKQCWVPDAKEGFIAAEIQSTKGEEVTVKTSKSEVCLLCDYSKILILHHHFISIYIYIHILFFLDDHFKKR